ncbi:MAG: DUF2911 domain-containing protein [Cyclobacteriaceae bacterium]
MGKTKQLLLVLGMCLATVTMAQLSTPPGGGNQKSVTKQFIGKVASVEIVYNSPDVTGANGQSRKGQIWGQLVPYGFISQGFGIGNPAPWRAGANENTTIEFSHDVLVEGKEVKAGKYGFFVAPAENGPWTIVLSTDNNHWGSFFYVEENDALRAEVEAKDVEFREWLSFEFIDRQPNSATAALVWENKMVPFKIEVKDNDKVTLAAITAELNNSAGFTGTNYQQAANYASGVGAHDQALLWADAAVQGNFFSQKTFGTMQTKAAVLRNAGKNDEAIVVMDEAIKLPGATAGALHQYGRQLITAGQNDKALEVFQYNAKTNKGVWPTNYGLARGYSAVGNYKQALKYLQLAKANVPANDNQNGPLIDQNIEKLKKGEDIN